MKNILKVTACFFLAIALISCKKDEIITNTKVENNLLNFKQQKEIHYSGWILQIFVVPGEDGWCFYYYRCLGVTYTDAMQCNPNNPQTMGFQEYPLFDANGEHVKVKCEDLSIVNIDDTTVIDNQSDLEQVRSAIEYLYENGHLLVLPDAYINN